MGLLDTLRSSSENGLARDASVADPSLDQLRAGDMLDYDDSTWTVTKHERFAHKARPVDRWTLTCGGDTRLLEHGPDGSAEFQLLRRATLADVTTVDGQPFLSEVQIRSGLDTIEYQGARHERTEMDARTALQDEQKIRVQSERSLMRAQLDRKLGGVFGGIAAYLGVPSVLLRFVVLLGLLATGIFVWELSYTAWGVLALAAAGAYGGVVLALPSARLSVEADAALSHYWLYEGEEGILALECWEESDWRAYEVRAAIPDEFENILPGERRSEEADPEAGIGTALRRLRESSLVDYDGSTWEVIRQASYESGKGAVNQWMLKHGGDVRVLEHEDDAGAVFRLSTPVSLTDVTVGDQPLLNAVPGGTAPRTLTYQGTDYAVARERTRFVGSKPSEGKRVRYWRYESDDGFVVLECRGKNDWSAHAGREVAPHAFEDVLPRPEEGFLSTLWDRMSLSDAPTPTELLGSTALHRLREDYMLDYDVQTWTVTEHTKYPYEGWPTDVWTLESDGEERELEYDRTEGGTFRLYRHVPVDAESFSGAGEREDPPDKVEYEGTQYAITEKDIRVHEEGRVREGEEDHISFLARSLTDRKLRGACGGLARHLRLPSWLVRLVFSVVVFSSVVEIVLIVAFRTGGHPVLKIIGLAVLGLGLIWGSYRLLAFFVPEAPPKVLSHYWVYESDEGGLVTLKRARGRWTMRVGREVEPYEFDNILPQSEG